MPKKKKKKFTQSRKDINARDLNEDILMVDRNEWRRIIQSIMILF